MKRRYIYTILFALPGLFIALLATFAIFGAVAGMLWLYVYGDNSWPASVEMTLPILFGVLFMGLWIASAMYGYHAGKRYENQTEFNRGHLYLSIGATVLPMVVVLLHQLSVGNIGAKSDGQLCMEYCSQQGYSASSMPSRNSGERSCSCLENGRAATTLQRDALINSD